MFKLKRKKKQCHKEEFKINYKNILADNEKIQKMYTVQLSKTKTEDYVLCLTNKRVIIAEAGIASKFAFFYQLTQVSFSLEFDHIIVHENHKNVLLYFNDGDMALMDFYQRIKKYQKHKNKNEVEVK